MKHEEGRSGPVLAYASQKRLRRPEWHDDGRQFVLLLPTRPLWVFVAWRTMSLVFWTVLGVAGTAAFAVLLLERPGERGEFLCLAVGVLGLAFAAYSVFDLVRASRSQRLPTMIHISADGVTVETSGWTKTRRLEFPRAIIRRTAVELAGPLLAQEFQICLRVLTADRESVTFLFTLRGQESVEALGAAVKRYLPPAQSPDHWLDASNVDVRLD